jgi:hypothetical protein
MNVLIKRFNEAPLSIIVLATLCRPIGILMMNGKFLSDSSVIGWSFGPNEISTSDHLILLTGSCGAGGAGGGILLRSRKVLHSSKSCPTVR